MHWYKRNLGDYAKEAGRLNMIQHGAYTLLIDLCFDREKFPTMEEAIEWTWASSKEEVEAVQFVLKRFFNLVDGVYVQHRIQEEIAEYHSKAETNKRIALERETKRREKSTSRERTVNEAPPEEHGPPPNHKPITNNQKPETINQDKDKDKDKEPSGSLLSPQNPKPPETKKTRKRESELVPRPDFVGEQIWNDWLLVRKKKGAPLTQTAWALMTNEVEKAGWPIEKAIQECCLRTWASFKAEWVETPRGQSLGVNRQEALEERNKRAADEWLAMMAKKDALDAQRAGEVVDAAF